jgi:Ca2+-binding EF-hand superfamily protein
MSHVSYPEPAITLPMLFARRKVPREAFAEVDREGRGALALDDMRTAFASLGVKLTLSEAKALVVKQKGDKTLPPSEMSFD